MNNYNNNFGYAGGYYGGMMYNQQQAPNLNMTQGLTPEQIKSLRRGGGFSLEVSEDEMLRSYCTHRQGDKFTVTFDDEGNGTCSLCGTKFKPFNGTVAEARELTNDFVGLIETAKMQSINLPPKVIQELFQIEPFVKRIPDLFSQSNDEYKRALGVDQQPYVYGQESNAFIAYQNMLNPMAGAGYYDHAAMNQQQVFGAQAYPQQQPMQMGYSQPAYAQPYQPTMNQQMGYQQPQQSVQGNPFNIGSQPVVNTEAVAVPTQGQTKQPETATVTANLTD